MYYRPDNLNDALDVLCVKKLKIAAGCTDLFPATQNEFLGDNILDISGIDSLRSINIEKQFRRIGATTTWSDLIKSELPDCYEMLKQCSKQVGSIQIQNSGTIGGNLCNASPAADGVPCLLSLNASIELSSKEKIRILKLEDFIKGSRDTELQSNELLTAILIPKTSENGHSSFVKLGARKYLVISISMVACRLEVLNDIITDITISIGSCSAVAQRLKNLENILIGKNIKSDLVPEIYKFEYNNFISPINDIRGTDSYRIKVAKVLVKNAVLETIDKF